MLTSKGAVGMRQPYIFLNKANIINTFLIFSLPYSPDVWTRHQFNL